MTRTIDFTQILNDEASFQLVRTNPKLTGNVKFTVDTNDNMWLNSIDANEELSKSIYKRVAIDPTVSLPGNMYKFFSEGATPSEIVFDLNESFDSTKTSSEYADQYDFSHYFSGVKYLPSRRYEEKLSYFAPIYLKQDIPDYFVIFKVDGPLNKNISDLKEEYPYNKESYIKDLFRKASIIKTFDLSAKTKIGKYLRDYVNDPLFPKAPLDVTYQEDQLTDFNGILYDSGVFGSRGEDLYEFYQTSNPLKYFEESITLGFERNGVIFPNILNMEFIFNDDTSDLYDFNRYIGLYVNTVELSKMEIDLERSYNSRGNWPNTPIFRKKYSDWEDVQVDQSNPDGVVLPFKNSSIYFSDFQSIFLNKDNLFFNYIKDRAGDIHLPKLSSPYDIDYDYSLNELNSAAITFSDKNIDAGLMFGPGNEFLQDRGSSTDVRGTSHAYIKIENPSTLETIKLYHPRGSKSDLNGKYETIDAFSSYSLIPNPGDFYVYNDIDGVSGYNIYYINREGTKSETATAIANCINQMHNASFKAVAIEDHVFIKINMSGDFDSTYYIEYVSTQSQYDSIKVNDITGSELNGTLVYFEGGSRPSGNRLIIESGHLDKIKSVKEDLLVKTESGWSGIKKVSRNIDAISERNLTTESDQTIALTEFYDKAVVTLENQDRPLVSNGEYVIFQKFKPEFGLLSIFPIKDFDFDFYSSEYLNFPKIDLYQYYYIPEGLENIIPGIKYTAYGTGTIVISNGEEYTINGSGTVEVTGTGMYSYTVSEGDVIIEAQSSQLPNAPTEDNKWAAFTDGNGELNAFEGFFLIKDPDQVVPESSDGLYTLRDKYLNGLARSEYDFFKENSSSDFALRSKVIPYITKWAIPDGLDSRSNPYRLNSELVFGYNNFSPDHEDRSQNPSNFTHEWYYVESKFDYVKSIDLIKENNSYFPEPFELDRALSEEGYFIDYFTYTPTFVGEEVGKTQTRYSPILKNDQGIYETFFKGFKIQFKDYIDPNNLNDAGKPEFNPISNRFEDYKFSCLLKPIKEDINDDTVPPIRYRFIEHKDFKFMLLLIEIRLGDVSSIEQYWESSGDTYITNQASSGDALYYLDDLPISPAVQAYDSINGDYRLKFSQVNGIDVSNLNHTLIYSLRNKKFNNLTDNFSTIKLSSKLDLKNAFQLSPPDSITKLNLNTPGLENYPSNINDELHVPTEHTFLVAHDKYFSEDRIADNFPQSGNYMESVGANYIKYDSAKSPDLKLRTASTGTVYQTIPSSSSTPQYTLNFYVFKIMSGGELYFETLFEKISFGEFKDRVNTLDPFIEYESYSYDGSVNSETSNIYTEIPDQTTITKKSAVVAVVDENKPSDLSFSSIIGFNYESSTLDNYYDLNRYEGRFAPLFRDVVFFNSKYHFNKNDISSLDLSNTRFNINIDSFMKLSNFNHIKISSNKILDLESSEGFDPVYELADEIAIGRKPYNLLESNWDWGFHHKYSTKKDSTPVSGTLRLEEDDSFVGKIVNLRDVIELEQFKISEVDRIDTININNYEIVYQNLDISIDGRINVENALTQYLLDDGISAKFIEYLTLDSEFTGNFETLEDYIKSYINLNITKLYEIIEVEFFVKEDRSISDPNSTNQNAIQFQLLSDKQRFEQGYKPIRDLQINNIDRFILDFKFNKKLNTGMLISPKIKIKFI